MDSNYSQNIPLFENYCKQEQIDNVDINCKIGSFPITLKVASTPQSQSKGYQHSKSEPSDEEGILFVYPREIPVSFWMKNVDFPLDIMFFNSNREMVHRDTMQPNTYPKRYNCEIPIQYAVETKAGWYERNGDEQLKLHL